MTTARPVLGVDHLRHESSRPSSSLKWIISSINVSGVARLQRRLSPASLFSAVINSVVIISAISLKKPQQTDPPTIPVVKLFLSGDFPEGEI
ncbi:unnamed protein product [Eruca vesicaria subsp. sativa]|uniref:Uncharacterized protein n=1 Tax=Eruca vesicaria subsp. sativa TaxID=29727 RepID=A0ABC8JFT0_ERUVS|nr:unnamed protein product [Eruca vesicaria subsp. sativa]